jgi:hypothetical protein
MTTLSALEEAHNAIASKYTNGYPPYAMHDTGVIDAQPKTCLNLHRNYMAGATSFSNQREFIQNWIDRCRDLCTTSSLRIQYDTCSIRDGSIDFYTAIEDNDNTRHALGYIAELRCGNIPMKTYICNFSTVLSQDILVMGNSTKRSNNESAGYYGEGVKVTINKFTACGITVQYRTGQNVWKFGYEGDVLHMTSERCPTTPSTTVLIQQTQPLMPPINAEDYLFLYRSIQPELPKFSLRSNELEVICYEKLLNRIYIKDIVCYYSQELSVKVMDQNKESTVGLALNFLGVHSQYASLGLGRDRNMVNVDAFIDLIPRMFAHDSGLPIQAKRELANYLYSMLVNAPDYATFGNRLWHTVYFNRNEDCIRQYLQVKGIKSNLTYPKMLWLYYHKFLRSSPKSHYMLGKKRKHTYGI